MAGKVLPEAAWVLVTDGEKALILENVGDEVHPFLQVRRKEEHDNPPTRDQGSDRPGRFSDGPSVQRSAVEDTDWHRLEKTRFAEELAALLYDRAHAGRFDRLVLVAAPQVLGALRGKLHKEVRDRVLAEIPKTLTNHPTDEIERRVVADLAAQAG